MVVSTVKAIKQLRPLWSRANLSGTNLSGADLSGANLTLAVAPGVNLSRTDLTNAILTNANLTNADLTNADLTGLIYGGANFNGAILTGAIPSLVITPPVPIIGTGVAHMDAARLNTGLPMIVGRIGSLGDATKTCGDASGNTVACPADTFGSSLEQCTSASWGASEIKDLGTRALFGADSKIFPGAVLQGKEYAGSTHVLVDIPRSGGTLELSNLTLAGPAYKVLQPTTGVDSITVNQAIKDILGADSNIMGTGANVSYVQNTTYSLSELSFNANAGGGFRGASLDALFNSSKKSTKNTVIVKFTQVYYIANFRPPTRDANLNQHAGTQFFRDGDGFQDPFNHIGTGNVPLYVSKVNYGRQVFFALTSSATESQIKASFKAAYEGAGLTVNVGFGMTAGDVLQNTEISYVALGGDASEGVKPLAGGTGDEIFKNLSNVLSSAKAAIYSSVNPPVAVSYELRQLDTDAVAKMVESVVYDKKDCVSLSSVPHRIEMLLSNIDDDIYLYETNAGGDGFADISQMTKVLYKSGGSASYDLVKDIGSEGERTYVLKLGNGGCGLSKLTMQVNVDGQRYYSGEYDTSPWSVHCGWQLEHRVTVNKNKGTIKVISDDGRLNIRY